MAGCHSLRLSILLCHLARLDLALPGFASLAKHLNRIVLRTTDNVGKSPSAVSARAFWRGVPWDKRPPAIWGLTRNAPFPLMERSLQKKALCSFAVYCDRMKLWKKAGNYFVLLVGERNQ